MPKNSPKPQPNGRDVGAEGADLARAAGLCACSKKRYPQSELEGGMTLQQWVHANEQPRQRTILLVEDEPFVREATCRILESAGFEVMPAEDAREAMKVYLECERGIDLVLTDMVLPGLPGLPLGQDLP